LALLDFNFETIPLHARVAYPSWDFQAVPFREVDHNAHFYTHAVKNDAKKIGTRTKNLKVGVNGESVLVSASNLIVVQRHFARFVARTIKDAGIADPVIIAIPNRDALRTIADFNTARLAALAAEAFGSGAQPYAGLRFKKLIPKTEKRRLRPDDLAPNMEMVTDLPKGTLVLLDDVYTQGHHVRASCKVLDCKPVLVCVAARTENEPLPNMTKPRALEHTV
jgi:hypothetical protein